jgi:hypothetical protein
LGLDLKEKIMNVPSLDWLQKRLKQLQSNSAAPSSTLVAMEALLHVFYCQFMELDDFGAMSLIS